MSWDRRPLPSGPMGQSELREGVRAGTLIIRPDGRVEWPGRGILKPEQLTPEANAWLAGYVAKQKKPKPKR
jgi:hypothetical protein